MRERVEKLAGFLAGADIGLALFEDCEARRDPAVRYLSGHPSDALLFVTPDTRTLLVPWDKEMARLRARADVVLPYSDFSLDPVAACAAALEHFNVKPGGALEIPGATPHPLYCSYAERLPGRPLLCREEGGAGAFVRAARAVKDAGEIALLRAAAERTDAVMGALEAGVRSGALRTEADVALFIEAECRARGCEGTGFLTLAAGARRSFAIHAVPACTAAPFADAGLSILDFGLVYEGYTSDVTMTFARGPLDGERERRIALVLEAYALVLLMLKGEEPIPEEAPADGGGAAGVPARALARAVDAFFERHGVSMPHGLGHGVGLQVHEKPYLRSRAASSEVLLPGMVFTVEPGLYAADGGCRYENDILLTPAGPEELTSSRVVRL